MFIQQLLAFCEGIKTKMFFAFMIQVVLSCQIYEKERNIFPTEQEYYNVFMNELFKGEDLIFECKNCPENVTLWNTMNLIGKPYNTGYIFRSIANNKSHFVALSDNNTINIYNWQDQSLKTVSILPIDEDLNCFNIIFTLNQQFLLDCYIDNMLQMYNLDGQNLQLVFEQQTSYSLKSNLYTFRSYSINYTIYAQYFEEYQILTLLKYNNITGNQTLLNVSTWISKFQDVEISIKGIELNTFYVLNDPMILLLQITEDEKFSVWNYFLINPPSYQMTIYQSINKYSECDQLFLKSDSQIYSLLVCEDQLDQELYQQGLIFYNIEENVEIKQFYANDYFLILQTNNSLMIISLETKTLLRETKMEYFQSFIDSQIYFNQQNSQLIIFNYNTFVYQIEMPRLGGYFQIFDPKIKNDEIFIFAINNFGINVCFVQLKIKTLNLNDYDIYQVYSQLIVDLDQMLMRLQLQKYKINNHNCSMRIKFKIFTYQNSKNLCNKFKILMVLCLKLNIIKTIRIQELLRIQHSIRFMNLIKTFRQ